MEYVPPKCYSEEEKEDHKPLSGRERSEELWLAVLSQIFKEKSDDGVEKDERESNRTWSNLFSNILFEKRDERNDEYKTSFEHKRK